ncbi:MAG: PAS domain S-box protein [Proteobacteria bacterium]|nr:PAS domain S-box protein [Pseudomonadota bacterium]MBU1687601.1 PAS domain S-box protein [Pseudomonadota bacterium]
MIFKFFRQSSKTHIFLLYSASVLLTVLLIGLFHQNFQKAALFTLLILLLVNGAGLLLLKYLARRDLLAQEKITESEKNFKEFAELFPQLVFELDLQGNLTFANRYAFTRTGYTQDDLTNGLTLGSLLHPNQHKKTRDDINRILRGNELSGEEHTIVHRDGSLIPVMIYATSILRDKKVIGIRGIALDISERKQAEQQLKESEERFRALYENAPLPYQSLDNKGCLIGVNTTWLTSTGYSREEVINRPFTDFLLPESQEQFHRIFPEVFAEQSSHTEVVPLLKKDGTTILASFTSQATYDSTGRFLQVHCLFLDITEQKKAEQALEKSYREWDQAMEFFEEAIYLVDLDDKVYKANSAFYRMTGLTPEQALGQDITEILHPEGELEPCPVCLARRERRDARIILEADHPDNPTSSPIEVTVKMIRSTTEDSLLGVLMMIRDLTQQRRNEIELRRHRDHLEDLIKERTMQLKTTYEQLMHAEKLSAVGRLSGSIAHEFNNPLQGIMSVLNRIQRTTILEPKNLEFVEMALTECNRIKNLIRDLQNFNRVSSDKIEEINFHSAIESILLMAKKELKTKGIQIIKEFDPMLPPVRTVADQLKQVILNLLNNAVDACDGEGTITIRTRFENPSTMALDLIDNGKGIKPEDMNHIFEPFFSTKPTVKGTGLGLPVSYGIIHRLGGEITVRSIENQGATFTVTLPVNRGKNNET